MSWARIDDLWLGHPKVRRAGHLAELVHVRSIVYCARHLTDGVIDAAAVPELFAGLDAGLKALRVHVEDVIGALVRERLWERHAGGFAVHDYLAYHPTRTDELARRMQRQTAGQKGGRRSAEVRRGPATPEATAQACAQAGATPLAYATVASKTQPRPRPRPKDKERKNPVVTREVDSSRARVAHRVPESDDLTITRSAGARRSGAGRGDDPEPVGDILSQALAEQAAQFRRERGIPEP